MLSIYYMAQDNYVKARHLLSGANHVFQEWQKKMDTLVEQADKTRDLEEKVRLKSVSDVYLVSNSSQTQYNTIFEKYLLCKLREGRDKPN